MKKDITPFNDKGQRHGYWELYYYNGQLYSKCVFINGKRNRFNESYWHDGKIRSKTYHL